MTLVPGALCNVLACGLFTIHWYVLGERAFPKASLAWQSVGGLLRRSKPWDKRVCKEVQRQLEWIRLRNAQTAARALVHIMPVAVFGTILSQTCFNDGSTSWLQFARVVVLVLIYAGAALVVRGRVNMEDIDRMYAGGWLMLLAFTVVSDKASLQSPLAAPIWFTCRISLIILLHDVRRSIPRELVVAATMSARFYYFHCLKPGDPMDLVCAAAELYITLMFSLIALMWETHPGIDRQSLFLLQHGLKALIDSLCDAQICLGADLCIKNSSPQLAHLLGWRSSPQTLDGTALVAHVAAADHDRLLRVLNEGVAADGSAPPPSCIHLDLLTHGGSVVPVKLYHVSTFDMMRSTREHLIGVQLVGLLGLEETVPGPETPGVRPDSSARRAAAATDIAWSGSMCSESSSACTLEGLGELEEVTATFDILEEGWPIHGISIVPQLVTPVFSSWVRHEDWPLLERWVQERVNETTPLHRQQANNLGPSVWKWPPWSVQPRYTLRAECSELRVPDVSMIRQEACGEAQEAEEPLLVTLKLRRANCFRRPRARLRRPSLLTVGET